MKTNQDGGSVTASDSAAAAKQLAADQTNAAGPAQREKVNNQTANKEGKDMLPDKMLKRGDVRADGSIVGEIKNTQKPTKREERITKKKRENKTSRNTTSGDTKNKVKKTTVKKKTDGVPDNVGPSRMGYAQKFGPGRMNGYDAGAKKVMDVMTYGGASKYMAEGPGQQKSGDLSRPTDYRERPAYTHTAAVDGNLTQSQIEKRGPCGGPGQRPCGTNELSAAEREVVNDGDMNNYLSNQVSNTPTGRGFQARMQSTLETNRARQRSADSSFVVGRGDRNRLSWMRDFDNNSQGGRPGGFQKGNVVGRYNAIDPDTGFIRANDKQLDPNTGSMTMTKSKANKPRKKA